MVQDSSYHPYVVKFMKNGKEKGDTVVSLPPLYGVWLPFLKQAVAEKLGERVAPGAGSYRWLEAKISIQLHWGDAKQIIIHNEDRFNLTSEQFHQSLKSLEKRNLGLVVAIIDDFTVSEALQLAAMRKPAQIRALSPVQRNHQPVPPRSEREEERNPTFRESYSGSFLDEDLRLYGCLAYGEVVVPRDLRMKIQALFNYTLVEVGTMKRYLGPNTEPGLSTQATAILDSGKLADMERKQAWCFTQIHMHNNVMPVGLDRELKKITK